MIVTKSHISIALQASMDASFVLMDFYQKGFSSKDKEDGTPVTEADNASSLVIHELLATTQIPIIGEEITNLPYEERKHWELNWCVDPLDGTKEFIKKNGEFAINIALISQGIPVFGCITSPTEQKIIYGGKGLGVFIAEFNEDKQITHTIELSKQPNVNQPVTLIASRSFHTIEINTYIANLEAIHGSINFHQKGSALKFFDIALGKADLYARFAPTMEWDIAAGQAILEELGGEIRDVSSGEKLVYNKENLLNPHFIAKSYAFIQQHVTTL